MENNSLIEVMNDSCGRTIVSCKYATSDKCRFNIHNPNNKQCFQCPFMKKMLADLNEYESAIKNTSDNYIPITFKSHDEKGNQVIKCKCADEKNGHLAVFGMLHAFESLGDEE